MIGRAIHQHVVAATLAAMLCIASGVARAERAPGPSLPWATLTLDATEAKLGQPVAGVLEAHWDPSRDAFESFENPAATTDAATSFSLALDAPRVDERAGVLRTKATVTAWELGDVAIEGVALALRSGDGHRSEPVPRITLRVRQASRATASSEVVTPLDKGTLRPPQRLWEEYPIAAIVLGLLWLGWLYGFVAWWRSRPRVVHIPTAQETALAALAALEEAPLDTQAEIEAFHDGIVETLRLYCGRRWLFYSARMTTSELDVALRKLAPDLAEDDRRELTGLFEEADMVRFARYDASKLTCRDRLARARSFVERTRLVTPAGAELPPAAVPGEEAA